MSSRLSALYLRLSILAVVQGRLLGIEGEMLPALAEEVIALSGGCDPAVAANAQRIMAELCREETKFGSTLEAGALCATPPFCDNLNPVRLYS